MSQQGAAPPVPIVGVDLFCGAGGLTAGLQSAGVTVAAGLDLDPACAYPYVMNNGSWFIEADIREVSAQDIRKLFPPQALRLLAGCAPCRPFSALRRQATARDGEWGLLREFWRLVEGVRPHFLTMENVPRLASKAVFKTFVKDLEELGYLVDVRSVYCPRHGIPQRRRRLVLIGSRIRMVPVPLGKHRSGRTVRQAISQLRPLQAGECDARDPLHRARKLSSRNLSRLQHSVPGGTWHDWPMALRAPCHRKPEGASYRSVYSRMTWDDPAPTITTQAHNFGTGRFGHPTQDRGLSLREAAILQSFPRSYRFTPPGGPVQFASIGRMIGNAVPPRLGKAIGEALLEAASTAITR